MSGDAETAQSSQVVVYTSESRLRAPLAFLRAGLRDLRGAGPTARRFFKRSLAQRYRFSSLGLAWAFAPSVITALVLTAGQRTKLITGHGQVPPPFYGVFGLTLGMTFLEALNALRSLFPTHQNLLRRNNVPLEGLILAAIIEVTFNTLVRMVVLVVAFFFFAVRPSFHTLPCMVVGIVGVVLLGSGLGLLFAPYNSLKRDIENIMTFLPWILFASTPVFVAARPGSAMALAYQVNPLAWIFDSIRTASYGAHGSLWPAMLALPTGMGMLILGWFACRLWRPYVVERSLV
jgi:lipopolysaccharide transport system permease protein